MDKLRRSIISLKEISSTFKVTVAADMMHGFQDDMLLKMMSGYLFCLHESNRTLVSENKIGKCFKEWGWEKLIVKNWTLQGWGNSNCKHFLWVIQNISIVGATVNKKYTQFERNLYHIWSFCSSCYDVRFLRIACRLR